MSGQTDWDRVLTRIGALAVRLQTSDSGRNGETYVAMLNEHQRLIAAARDDPEGRAAVKRIMGLPVRLEESHG